MADERTRYSDAELEEFKQLILKKLENARADYELLRATITHTADNDTEDTSCLLYTSSRRSTNRCRASRSSRATMPRDTSSRNSTT